MTASTEAFGSSIRSSSAEGCSISMGGSILVSQLSQLKGRTWADCYSMVRTFWLSMSTE